MKWIFLETLKFALVFAILAVVTILAFCLEG